MSTDGAYLKHLFVKSEPRLGMRVISLRPLLPTLTQFNITATNLTPNSLQNFINSDKTVILETVLTFSSLGGYVKMIVIYESTNGDSLNSWPYKITHRIGSFLAALVKI